jgi:Co/Zn/Cd efflux system component
MSAECCPGGGPAGTEDRLYRRVLWIAFSVNAAMFLIEIAAGIGARSVSLQADAIDFLGDAANYLVSLAVLGMAVAWRARASLLKAAAMIGFGVWVIGAALWHVARGTVPDAEIIGAVGFLALLANVGVAMLLFQHREGDSNRRSVWLCTRNDAIGNLAVLLAAAGVFGTGSGWPDVLVATIMAVLALSSGWRVARQAIAELRHDAALARPAA